MSKVDVPDMHSESIEELREAFELFDIKGIGKSSVSSDFVDQATLIEKSRSKKYCAMS